MGYRPFAFGVCVILRAGLAPAQSVGPVATEVAHEDVARETEPEAAGAPQPEGSSEAEPTEDLEESSLLFMEQALDTVPSVATSQSANVPSGAAKTLTESAHPASLPNWEGVTTFQLPNGIRVALESPSEASHFQICSLFEAGISAPLEGVEGASRVVSEILRRGGYRTEREDYEALVESRGGEHFLFLDHESVAYCTRLPRRELPLALWLVKSRYSSRALHQNELTRTVARLRQERDARDLEVLAKKAPERLRRLIFLGDEPLSRIDLPDQESLDRLTLAELRSFYEANYTPVRSTLVLSGGFDAALAQQEVHNALDEIRGGAPPGSRPPRHAARQTTPRYSLAEDKATRAPFAYYGFRIPQGEAREPFLLGVTALLRPDGRLHQRLAGSLAPGTELELSAPLAGEADPVSILFRGRGSQSLAALERELSEELARVEREGFSAPEIDDAKRRIQERAQIELAEPVARARRMGQAMLLGGSYRALFEPSRGESASFLERSERSRLALVQGLSPFSRSVVEVYPEGFKDPFQTPMPLFHVVSPGETLLGIAKQYGTTVAAILKLNPALNPKKAIYPGSKFRVPRGKKPKEAEPLLHRVKGGDTLSGLAARYGVSIQEIADQNGISPQRPIRQGIELRIPRPRKDKDVEKAKADAEAPVGTRDGGAQLKPSEKPSGTPAKDEKAARTYMVRSGDTLGGIAKRHGTTVEKLRQRNHLPRGAVLQVGQSLKIEH